MDCSRNSSLMEAVELLSELPDGVSSLIDQIAYVAKMMLFILERGTPCSKRQISALEEFFISVQKDILTDDFSLSHFHHLIWEPVAMYFLLFIIQDCRRRIVDEKEWCCMWADETCIENCLWNRTSEKLRKARRHFGLEMKRLEGNPLRKLFILTGIASCPICYTSFSHSNTFFCDTCNHIACIECSERLATYASKDCGFM